MGSWTRRLYGNKPIARETAKWRLRECECSIWWIFEIGICSSNFQPHGTKHSERHYRHHENTRLLTDTQYNRQSKDCHLPSYIRGSQNTRPNFKTFHTKTCTNRGGPRTVPRHNQDLCENGIGRLHEIMAQLFAHCNLEFQHDLPFRYWLWTKPSISWESST